MAKSSVTNGSGRSGDGGSGGMSKAAGGPTESRPKGEATAVSAFSLGSSNSPKKNGSTGSVAGDGVVVVKK